MSLPARLLPRTKSRIWIVLLILAATDQPTAVRAAGSGTAWTARFVLETPQSEIETLQPGLRIRATITGRNCHAYRLWINADHFARITLDQGIRDLRARILDPRGGVQELDGRWHGPEELSVRAATDGWYRVEVCSVLDSPRLDSFTIEVLKIEPFQPGDSRYIDAERLASEGKKLFGQGTATSLKAAVDAYENALPLWKSLKDIQGEAHTLNALGVILGLLGKPDQALARYQVALQLFQQLEYAYGQAETLHNIGAAHSSMGNRRSAVPYYEQAIRIYQASDNPYGQLFSLNSLAIAYFERGEPQPALEYFERVLTLGEAVGNRQIRAVTYNNLGGVYDVLGEPQKALESYDRGLQMCLELRDRRCEANVHRNRGVLNRHLGNFEQSLEQLSKAIEAAIASGDPRARAISLQQLGATYQEMARLDDAQRNFSEALSIFQTVRDKRGEGVLRLQMGKLSFDRGAIDEALKSYETGMDLVADAEDIRSEAQGHHGIGLVHAARGEPELAKRSVAQALSLAGRLNDRHTEAQMLLSLAKIERDLNELDAAKARMELAIELVEGLRGKVLQERLRTSFFASKQQFFETYIDVLMRLHERHPASGFNALAVEVNERSRARSLVDMLSLPHVDIREGANPELLEQERTLQQQLSSKAQRQMVLGAGKQSASQAAELGKEIHGIIDQLDALGAEMRLRSPRYAGLTRPEPVSAAEIRNEMLDDDTALLEYALGDQQSYAWVVTRRSIASAKLPPRVQIENAARRVYELVTARNPRARSETPEAWARRVATAEAMYPKAAHDLTQIILQPLAPHLRMRRLVVVPDGALQYLPFSALPDPASAGQPLIVDHEIVCLPSISALRLLRRETVGRPAPKGNLAVLADPVFDPADSRLAGRSAQSRGRSQAETRSVVDVPLSRDLERALTDIAADGGPDANFQRLTGSRREATMIGGLVPRGQLFMALDFEASRDVAMSPLLATYRRVHFATHGIINAVHPELSGLVFSRIDRNGRPKDGFLRAHEIYNLRLPVDLVVLSACRTGLGREVKGEGLISLSRGFMYAGARRIAVSLWKIEDDGTVELMEHFYRAMLRESLSPPAALQRAQVSMWKSGRAPFYWAAFVIQGEWQN